MNVFGKIILSLTIGALVGLLSAIPMFIRGVNLYFNLSIFVFWIVMGFIIANVSLPISSWLKGSLIVLLSAAPIMILVFTKDPRCVVPMYAVSVILGGLIGFLENKFIKAN